MVNYEPSIISFHRRSCGGESSDKLMLMLVPSVHGCSCLVPDTAVERANDVRNSRTKLAVIARFTNETTYIDIDENREHGPQEMETQNT